jgi:hypothetical protein
MVGIQGYLDPATIGERIEKRTAADTIPRGQLGHMRQPRPRQQRPPAQFNAEHLGTLVSNRSSGGRPPKQEPQRMQAVSTAAAFVALNNAQQASKQNQPKKDEDLSAHVQPVKKGNSKAGSSPATAPAPKLKKNQSKASVVASVAEEKSENDESRYSIVMLVLRSLYHPREQLVGGGEAGHLLSLKAILKAKKNLRLISLRRGMMTLTIQTQPKMISRGRGLAGGVASSYIYHLFFSVIVPPGEDFKTTHILRRYYTNLGQRLTKDSYSLMVIFISLFIGEHYGAFWRC